MKRPSIFKGRAEHDRQYDRLAQKLGDPVPDKRAFPGSRRPPGEPDHATAQVERGHLERQHRVIGRVVAAGAREGMAISGLLI